MEQAELGLELFDHHLHHVRAFRSGTAIMDAWIKRYAKRSQKDDLTRVHVLVERKAEVNEPSNVEVKRSVLGFFALSMCHIYVEDIRPEERAALPRYPIGAVLLTRLAVHETLRRKGWGGALLLKAAQKAVHASRHVAARVMVVDAIDDTARAFYEHFDFVAMPSSPNRLYINLNRWDVFQDINGST